MYATHRVLCQTYEYVTGMDATTIRAEQTKLGRSERSTAETKESATGQITTTRPLNSHYFERGGLAFLLLEEFLFTTIIPYIISFYEVAQKSLQWSGTTIVIGMLTRCTAILDAFVTGRRIC